MHKGLSQNQVDELLIAHGPNSLGEESKVNALKILWQQLQSPLILILFVAGAIAFALGEVKDTAFILAVVVVNTALSFIQEYKAENTLALLKKSVSHKVTVIRDGTRQRVNSLDLVPGDVIVIEPGLRVPADAKIIEQLELSVDEAVLTGESKPVEKKVGETTNKDGSVLQENCIYNGSVVLSGLGAAVVFATGKTTYLGKIATQLSSQKDISTPIKQELLRISKLITVIIVVVTVAIFAIGYLRGIELKEMLLTAVALGVSSIPEGLILALTITLAIGMNRIMKRGAIVKNLPAAETLGDIDVLCVDKTGTLTLGIMNVVEVHFTNAQAARRALAICNNQSNFIDKALLNYLNKIEPSLLTQVEEERSSLLPFSSSHKYTAASDGNHIYMVGAPEVIIENLKTSEKQQAQTKLDELTKLGMRMIAVAHKQTNADLKRGSINGLSFLGIVCIDDPVRESVKSSFDQINKAGVDVKVITGDLKETAVHVLQKLGRDLTEDQIVSGAELDQLTSNTPEFDRAVARCNLFYRTTPEHKLLIVKSLQRHGKRIGMMGDGVNDSPALKRAEIGIAVDNATDVSKEVADIVLLKTDFATIVDAVAEGRNIFANLRKIVTFLFAGNWAETTLIFLALIVGLPLPLLPLQLLWINLIVDGLPSLSLSFDKPNAGLLNKPPRSKSSSVLNKRSVSAIIAASAILNVLLFMIFHYMFKANIPISEARTFVFTTIALNSLVFLYSAKTIDGNIWHKGVFNNPYANISVILGAALTFLPIYYPPLQDLLKTSPLSAAQLLQIAGLTFLTITFTEFVKWKLHQK